MIRARWIFWSVRRGDDLLAAIVAGAIVALVAAPTLTSALIEGTATDEASLGRVVAHAFGGIGASIAGAAVAASTWGATSTSRRAADALIDAGAESRDVSASFLVARVVAASLGAAVAAAIVVALLRVGAHVGGARAILFDVGATAWSSALSVAVWSSIALACVARTGRGWRAFAVVLLDLATRAIPGAMSALSPSTHVTNVLGAPPPPSLVHRAVIAQGASVAALIAFAAIASAIATARHRSVRSA